MAKETPKEKIDGLVLYIDGSCVPNPGNGGWGMHGYAFSETPPKKGSGCSTDYPTNMGYVLKDLIDGARKGTSTEEILSGFDFDSMKNGTQAILEDQLNATEVTVQFYVDAFGATGPQSTNNEGEAMALLKAFEYILNYEGGDEFPNVFIFSDSLLTLRIFNEVLHKWAANRWVKQDGGPIKNLEIWKRIWAIKDDVMNNRNVHTSWLPGHSIFLGNQRADINANLGKNCTLHCIADDVIEYHEAQGYWKDDETDKHPLFVHQKLFFNGDHVHHRPGVYHMGAIDKDLGLVGKRLSDTSYSYIRTAKPVETIEEMVKIHCDIGRNRNETVILSLAGLYRSSVFERLKSYGKVAFQKALSYINNLVSVDKVVVTEVVDPPKKAMDAILALNSLELRVNEIIDDKNANGRYFRNQLNDYLYEQVEVKKKKETVLVGKLKDSIKPGMNSLKVDLKFVTDEGTELVMPTILTFSIDLPDRNTFKKIEDMTPDVSVYTWQESPGIFRYFSIVTAGEDLGAYCGEYSNLRLAAVPRPKKA